MNNPAALNAMSSEALASELRQCCGSGRWVQAVVDGRPYATAEDVYAAADAAWAELDDADWQSVFAVAERPQAGVADTALREAAELALRLYEERFGIPFITGAPAGGPEELLMRVRIRLGNDADTELEIARDEQRRLSRGTLQRLLRRSAP